MAYVWWCKKKSIFERVHSWDHRPLLWQGECSCTRVNPSWSHKRHVLLNDKFHSKSINLVDTGWGLDSPSLCTQPLASPPRSFETNDISTGPFFVELLPIHLDSLLTTDPYPSFTKIYAQALIFHRHILCSFFLCCLFLLCLVSYISIIMADNKNGHPSTMIKSIKMIAHNGWMIVKVFSPPVHNTILRLLALWCFVTYVIIVFLFTLLVSSPA